MFADRCVLTVSQCWFYPYSGISHQGQQSGMMPLLQEGSPRAALSSLLGYGASASSSPHFLPPPCTRGFHTCKKRRLRETSEQASKLSRFNSPYWIGDVAILPWRAVVGLDIVIDVPPTPQREKNRQHPRHINTAPPPPKCESTGSMERRHASMKRLDRIRGMYTAATSSVNEKLRH